MELVPGLEISAAYTGGGMHILGYFIDHADPFFQQELERLQEARRERNPKIVRRLQELGIPITYDQVLALSGGQIGRPHIAQAMLQIGAVESLDEAEPLPDQRRPRLTRGNFALFRTGHRPDSPGRGHSGLAVPFTLNCATMGSSAPVFFGN